MKPIKNNIFAQKIKEEQKTESGIILPEKTKKANLYKVLAIGNNVKHIKVGDTVKKYNGSIRPVIDFDGTDVEVLRENGDIEFIM